MSTFADLYLEQPTPNQQCSVPTTGGADRAKSQFGAIHDSKIQALVQQLFFRGVLSRVRNVGFLPIEATTTTSGLCLEVARCLADQGKYDVALVDCGRIAATLPVELPPTPSNDDHKSWLIAPNLWMVAPDIWAQDPPVPAAAENAFGLPELNSEFDFSIIRCEPLSNLETAVARACDGVVLVLTANKTRRLVASQIRAQMDEMKIPVLGSVLLDRNFPIPSGLYRKL